MFCINFCPKFLLIDSGRWLRDLWGRFRIDLQMLGIGNAVIANETTDSKLKSSMTVFASNLGIEKVYNTRSSCFFKVIEKKIDFGQK